MKSVTFTGLALALSVMPLLAHHSVAAEYDMSTTITIADATVSNWELEFPPPNTQLRIRGRSGEPNNAGRDLFRQGDQVSVTLWRAKDGAILGHALTIAFPDGRVMNLPRGWLNGDAGSNPANSKSATTKP